MKPKTNPNLIGILGVIVSLAGAALSLASDWLSTRMMSDMIHDEVKAQLEAPKNEKEEP